VGTIAGRPSVLVNSGQRPGLSSGTHESERVPEADKAIAFNVLIWGRNTRDTPGCVRVFKDDNEGAFCDNRVMDPDRILKTLMPNTYVKLLAQDFPDHEHLAHGVGIEPGELETYSRSITVAQHLQCVRNAIAMSNEPDWHLRWGQRMAENFHGHVTLAMLAAPTLGDGLDALVKYIPGRVPYHAWRRANGREYSRYEVAELVDLDVTRCTLVEVPLIVMYEYVRIYQPGSIASAAIELTYGPPRHAPYFSRWFDCPVKFNCTQNALVVPHTWLALKSLDFDETAWHNAIARCEAIRPTDAEPGAVAQVSRLINEHFEANTAKPVPTMEEIATSLRLSSRTLIRRLRENDTTYRQIVDEILKKRASDMMAGDRYKLHEIATRLGYADPKNFRRAFKRWYGMTPTRYRDEIARGSNNRPGAASAT